MFIFILIKLREKQVNHYVNFDAVENFFTLLYFLICFTLLTLK